jgi:hypothetical protein
MTCLSIHTTLVSSGRSWWSNELNSGCRNGKPSNTILQNHAVSMLLLNCWHVWRPTRLWHRHPTPPQYSHPNSWHLRQLKPLCATGCSFPIIPSCLVYTARRKVTCNMPSYLGNRIEFELTLSSPYDLYSSWSYFYMHGLIHSNTRLKPNISSILISTLPQRVHEQVYLVRCNQYTCCTRMTFASTTHLLALSSNVLSIHWVDNVISGSWTRHIRWRPSEQHRSQRIGFLL